MKQGTIRRLFKKDKQRQEVRQIIKVVKSQLDTHKIFYEDLPGLDEVKQQ